MHYTKESRIATLDDVKEFFGHLVNERRVAFHPDERFEDYAVCSTLTLATIKN